MWISVTAIVLVASIFVVGLYISSFPLNMGEPASPYELYISQVTFGSTTGQVIFTLNNVGTRDVTIIEVIESSSTSPNASVSTNALVHSGANLSLNVTFSNTTFQPGIVYNFILVTAQGQEFPYAVTR
jgi:hypothetical protein